jgi:hypothetical protein
VVVEKKHLLGYYKSTGRVTPYSYWNNTNCKEIIPRQNFLRKIEESGMKALRGLDQKNTDNYALSRVKIYLNKSNGKKHGHKSEACSSDRFLTDNEELALVQLVRLIGSMGGGTTKSEFMTKQPQKAGCCGAMERLKGRKLCENNKMRFVSMQTMIFEP